MIVNYLWRLLGAGCITVFVDTLLNTSLRVNQKTVLLNGFLVFGQQAIFAFYKGEFSQIVCEKKSLSYNTSVVHVYFMILFIIKAKILYVLHCLVLCTHLNPVQ